MGKGLFISCTESRSSWIIILLTRNHLWLLRTWVSLLCCMFLFISQSLPRFAGQIQARARVIIPNKPDAQQVKDLISRYRPARLHVLSLEDRMLYFINNSEQCWTSDFSSKSKRSPGISKIFTLSGVLMITFLRFWLFFMAVTKDSYRDTRWLNYWTMSECLWPTHFLKLGIWLVAELKTCPNLWGELCNADDDLKRNA